MARGPQELLEREKELTRRSDELAKQRRELPRVRIDKPYAFETDEGTKTLAELFEGRSQLIVYHFMHGPNTPEGCEGCTFATDSFDGSVAFHGSPRKAPTSTTTSAPGPRRTAATAPAGTSARRAELDGQRPFSGPALIGGIDGDPAGAVSLFEGRVIADPFQPTTVLRQVLRMRLDALRAYSNTPALAERVRAAMRPFAAAHPSGA